MTPKADLENMPDMCPHGLEFLCDRYVTGNAWADIVKRSPFCKPSKIRHLSEWLEWALCEGYVTRD
jgi:hypothetical protein